MNGPVVPARTSMWTMSDSGPPGVQLRAGLVSASTSERGGAPTPARVWLHTSLMVPVRRQERAVSVPDWPGDVRQRVDVGDVRPGPPGVQLRAGLVSASTSEQACPDFCHMPA
ncbi:hypothetical protein GCM10027610_122880 [Dactylosporangium cerinum]